MDFFSSFGSRKEVKVDEALDEDEIDLDAPLSKLHPVGTPLPAVPMPVRTPTLKSGLPSQPFASTSSSQPQSQPRLQILLDVSPSKALDAYMPVAYLSEDELDATLVASNHRQKHQATGRPPATAPCGATQPREAPFTPSVATGATHRKIGRPKGARNLTPAERAVRSGAVRLGRTVRARERRTEMKARAESATGGQQQPPKKRGRPAKTAETPAQTFRRLTPKFLPFGCEWKGCPAELQNMQTLRWHVAVVHRRSEVCLWGKCAAKEPPVALVTEDEFVSHMEKAHLIPYQWHMGDGYRNTPPGEEKLEQDDKKRIPAYLCDRDGNMVTPSIADQQIEDFATWRRNRQRLKEYLIQRNENAPLEEESEGDDGDLPVA